MSESCAGAAIPKWGAARHWGQATCRAGPFGESAIGVMEGSGLAVADGVRPEVARAGAGPGGLGVNPHKFRTGISICGAGSDESGTRRGQS